MQFPKGRHWKKQECEVRNTVENSGSFETPPPIKAIASSEKLIQEFRSRATSEYLDNRCNQVEEKDRPYTELDRNKHGRFPCYVDDEDSLVLKKDRNLDEANSNVVHDIINV